MTLKQVMNATGYFTPDQLVRLNLLPTHYTAKAVGRLLEYKVVSGIIFDKHYIHLQDYIEYCRFLNQNRINHAEIKR